MSSSEEIWASLVDISNSIDKLARQQPTLRDQFAMAALNGLLSDQSVNAPHDEFASASYKVADAMMKARSSE